MKVNVMPYKGQLCNEPVHSLGCIIFALQNGRQITLI